MEQIEREYRDAMDGLRFSGGAKERMVDKLLEQREQAPVKRRGVRPLRAALIAAVVCVALVGTAGAANVIARQANVNFFDSFDEYVEAQRAKSERGGVDYGIVVGAGDLDYDELDSMDMDFWWNGEDSGVSGGYTVVTDSEGVIIGEGEIHYDSPAQELVEETAGAAGDGWTTKRVFRYEVDGQTYLDTKYRAEALSGYNGLWNSWDSSWLEERYTPVPDQTQFEAVELNGEPCRTYVFGEFRGEGDTVFNVAYTWNSGITYEDQNFLSAPYDYTEHYTTADGVTAAIEMSTSHTGKTLFWVSLYSGHSSFSMFGTQVELDELHDILDSLNLSNLLEYVAEE